MTVNITRRAFMRFIVVMLLALTLSGCGDSIHWFPDTNTTQNPPATATSTHTALCVDGTYSDSATCSGTCSSHGGVQTWYNSDCGTSPTLGTATALCKDGFLSYSLNCSGTCSSHGGVQTWYTSACGGTVGKDIILLNFTGAYSKQPTTD